MNELLKLGQQSPTVFVWWDNVKVVLWSTFAEVFSLWQDIFEDAVRAVSDQGYTPTSFHLSYMSLKVVDLLIYLKNLIYLFYFILTLIWLVSYAELLDTCLFSQKTFEGIKTKTWVRLGNYLEEYTVSGENKITEMIDFLARVGVLS